MTVALRERSKKWNKTQKKKKLSEQQNRKRRWRRWRWWEGEREREKTRKQEMNRLNTVAMYDNHIFEIYICSIRLVHIKSPCIWCIFVVFCFFFSHPTIKRAYIKNLLNDTHTDTQTEKRTHMKRKQQQQQRKRKRFIYNCINNQKKNFYSQQYE